MSLTDLQAGLMLGFTGGFACGGLLAFVVYSVSFRAHVRRSKRIAPARNTPDSH